MVRRTDWGNDIQRTTNLSRSSESERLVEKDEPQTTRSETARTQLSERPTQTGYKRSTSCCESRPRTECGGSRVLEPRQATGDAATVVRRRTKMDPKFVFQECTTGMDFRLLERLAMNETGGVQTKRCVCSVMANNPCRNRFPALLSLSLWRNYPGKNHG